MGEGVAIGVVGGSEHGGGHSGIAQLDQRVLVDAGHAGQQGHVEVAADHRGQRQHPLGLATQTGEPVPHHFLHADW